MKTSLTAIFEAMEEALPADLGLLFGSFLASHGADQLVALHAIEERLQAESHATRWLPRPAGLDADASAGALEVAMQADMLAIVVNWLQSALRAQARGDMTHADQIADRAGKLLDSLQRKETMAPAHRATPWTSLRVGMTFDEVAALEIPSCIGTNTPDCRCRTCQAYEALVCTCGDPFVDHGGGGDHSPCALCGCEVFSLASWAGGPPAPPKEPRTPPRAPVVSITTAPVARKGRKGR